MKMDIYANLCGGIPDAISVFAASAVTNKATGRRKSSAYGDPDPHGLLGGGKARSIAGAELWSVFPKAEVVANSKLPADGEQLSLARVMKWELEKYGVPSGKIILQENSYSTLTELIGLVKLATSSEWHHVTIVLSETQIARTKIMWEQLSVLKDRNDSYLRAWDEAGMDTLIKIFKILGTTLSFVSAEAVLAIRSPRYIALWKKVKTTELYHLRVESEVGALESLRNGTYGAKHPTFIEHPR